MTAFCSGFQTLFTFSEFTHPDNHADSKNISHFWVDINIFKNNDNEKLHIGVDASIDIDSGLEDNDNHGESLKAVFCRLQIGLLFCINPHLFL